MAFFEALEGKRGSDGEHKSHAVYCQTTVSHGLENVKYLSKDHDVLKLLSKGNSKTQGLLMSLIALGPHFRKCPPLPRKCKRNK